MNGLEEASQTITYIGLESLSGTWWIKKIDSTSGIQHASVSTDPSYTTYTTAWTNRATLTYSDYQDAF